MTTITTLLTTDQQDGRVDPSQRTGPVGSIAFHTSSHSLIIFCLLFAADVSLTEQELEEKERRAKWDRIKVGCMNKAR